MSPGTTQVRYSRVVGTRSFKVIVLAPPGHGTKARLLSLERSALGGIIAHGTCFAVHLLVSAAALFAGHLWGALWILLPGVATHLYPVLLQRSIMLRLQPLLNERSTWDFG